MLKETLGEKLKTAREAKRLSVRDVTRETNIVQRYIEALENNDFNKFPGETYLLGFLRSYGSFLRLDEDELLRLYKGQQISESQTPLEELTKPTSSITFGNLFDKEKLMLTGKILSILIAIFLLIKFAVFVWESMGEISMTTIEYSTGSKKIPKLDSVQRLQLVRDKGEILLKIEQSALFRISSIDYAFRLTGLEKDKASLETYPGGSKVFLPLQKEIESLIPDCPRQLLFRLKAVSPNTAKIELKLGKHLKTDALEASKNSKTKVETSEPEKLILRLHLELMDNSYVETYLDGKKEYAGLLKRGQEMNWTAKQTIQLHLGNSDGVRINVNGKDYKFPGKVKNKIFSWKRDPLNPSVYEVTVNENQ